MLTTKPLLSRHYYPMTGNSVIIRRYAESRGGLNLRKFSDRDTIRERYRKPSLRLRPVGSKEQTSVKLTRIYEVPASNGIYYTNVPQITNGPIITTHSVHDEGAPMLADVDGIEYYRDMTEFFARYPEYIGQIKDVMDAQVTVDYRHMPPSTRPTRINIDNFTVVDGMPLLLKDQ